MKSTAAILFWCLLLITWASAKPKPNVVLVITDDQGYGDLACHGNQQIRTPHIDALAAESTSLTDYHVAPTCSPTRAALLTGHWTNRTGVWHTINGRSMLRANEVTLGRYLQGGGYATGMFGKWHLGDNYPYRPEDRGFQEVYRHGGGGVGQTPDLWDNAYFDGQYFHNGEVKPAKGFCTDVFFEQGNAFIKRCAEAKKPFFAYICANAPHGPLHCPQKYLDLYSHLSPSLAAFFGMITNIDDNVGKTRALLKELGIEENTMFIFTTDNGTATGEKVFNAGMRGKKGSAYDGGHRVPLFLHWPGAGLAERREVATLTHAVDVVPTLLDLTEVTPPASARFDGLSLKPLLLPGKESTAWPDRFLVTDSQRVRDPIKWKTSAVMSERFRLINGKELYLIESDPGQTDDVASQHPEQVAKMRAFYEAWWSELEPTFAQTTEIIIGHPDHPLVSLTAHDWIHNAGTPWNQRHIRNGLIDRPRGDRRSRRGDDGDGEVDGERPGAEHSGHWAIKVERAGEYAVELRRWPMETDVPIRAGLPPGEDVPGATTAFRGVPGAAFDITRATLRVNEQDLASGPVKDGDRKVVFKARLTEGKHRLSPVFHTREGDEVGAYYVVLRRLGSG